MRIDRRRVARTGKPRPKRKLAHWVSHSRQRHNDPGEIDQESVEEAANGEGAGVRPQRVFGFSRFPMFDPFLFLDDFRSDNPAHFLKGFPWHPHRGIETITYVLRGDVEHGDSMGNRGIITAGDVQWMTAGSGVIHQEMLKVIQGG